MQDRYLFRGKRIDNGEWVHGYLFDDGFENGRVFIGGIVIENTMELLAMIGMLLV